MPIQTGEKWSRLEGILTASEEVSQNPGFGSCKQWAYEDTV